MKRALDVRSGRVLVALGTLGISGGYTASAAAMAGAQTHRAERRPASPGPQTRRAVVFTDSVGAAAAALRPDRPLAAVPVVSGFETRRNLLIGGRIWVRGTVEPITATDRAVGLQEQRGGRWVTVARSRTHRLGRYHVGFRPQAPGTVRLRVLVEGASTATHARRTLGAVNIYRRAFVSWYGGGGPLACGGMLTNSTLGVASKTLPCGTMVGLRLGHRAVRVPVIDRGPYVAGREFDLTAATKRALGFGDLGVIWATA
jgi:peptidoglycan lytic transglycosylase